MQPQCDKEAARIKHDRRVRITGACDGAEIRNGVGYKPHPTDCAQFIHCYYRDVTGSTDKRVSPVYRQCEFGMFWDQKNFRCAPSYTVDCMQGIYFSSIAL